MNLQYISGYSHTLTVTFKAKSSYTLLQLYYRCLLLSHSEQEQDMNVIFWSSVRVYYINLLCDRLKNWHLYSLHVTNYVLVLLYNFLLYFAVVLRQRIT